MFNKDYWKMSNDELEKVARAYHLQHFLEPSALSRDDGNPDYVINRKEIIDQLVQRDSRNTAFWSAVVALVGAVISLLANFVRF